MEYIGIQQISPLCMSRFEDSKHLEGAQSITILSKMLYNNQLEAKMDSENVIILNRYRYKYSN